LPSIRENIILDLKQTLEDMSEGAGYHYDWEDVWLFPPKNYGHPWALISENTERQIDLVYPKIERVLEVEIAASHRVLTSSADAPSTASRALIADLERAVMQDPKRAGNAVDTSLVRTDPPILAADAVGVVVVIEIKYHTNRKDPNATV